jgi:hypothetical protein
MSSEERGTSPAPALRIVRGGPSAEELAALVAVVAALPTGAGEPRRPRSSWADPVRGVRRPHPHGPGGWRTSHLPG